MMSERDLDRFWQKIDKSPSSGCWMWTASVDGKGYGKFRLCLNGKSRTIQAYRITYEYLVSSIPRGMHLHHKCGVRRCVNPNHLQVMTPEDHLRLHPSTTKTHCTHGHPIFGENLYIRPNGTRSCKECRRKRARAYKRAQKEAANA